MKIGIAGTGRMGTAMGARLLELKQEVHVWNRSPARTRPCVDQGAVSAAQRPELAGRCDAVLTILTDAAAIDAVYNGQDGCSPAMSGESSSSR
jgi:3-hydroxyisobutyrate dehydrogenase